MHLTGVDPPRGHGHHSWEVYPVLIEVDALGEVLRLEVLPAGVVVAGHGVGIAL